MMDLSESYRILGVEPTASAQDVRQAYLNLAKRWHPDRQQNSFRSKQASMEHFLKIQSAYHSIKQKQTSTVDFLVEEMPQHKPKSTPLTRPISDLSESDQRYEKAVQLARQGLYQSAIAELTTLIQLDPKYSLAYKYRASLNAYLGYDHDSRSDFMRAHVVELNNAATEGRPYDEDPASNADSEPAMKSNFRKKAEVGALPLYARFSSLTRFFMLFIPSLIIYLMFQLIRGLGNPAPEPVLFQPAELQRPSKEI